MKTLSKLAAFILCFALIHSCNDDEGNSTGENPEEISVNDAVISLEEIYTAPEDQIETDDEPLFAVHNDKIYVAGFTYSQDMGHYTELWEYTPETNTYAQKADGCESCSWSGYSLPFFSDGNLIYHIDVQSEPHFEYFNPLNNQWGVVNTELPNAIGRDTEVLAIENKVYFLGGFADDYDEWEETDNFSYFNTQTGQWVNLAPHIDSVYGPIMVYDEGDYIYAIGGGASDGGVGQEVYTFARYSISQNNWEQLPDLPHIMISDYNGKKAQIVDNRFIVVVNFFDSAIHIYDIEEEAWKEEPYQLNFWPQAILKVDENIYVAQTVSHSGTYSHKFHKLNIDNLPN